MGQFLFLKRFCLIDSKNVFVLVLAYLEPEQELIEVDDIGDDALARVLDELGPKRKHF